MVARRRGVRIKCASVRAFVHARQVCVSRPDSPPHYIHACVCACVRAGARTHAPATRSYTNVCVYTINDEHCMLYFSLPLIPTSAPPPPPPTLPPFFFGGGGGEKGGLEAAPTNERKNNTLPCAPKCPCCVPSGTASHIVTVSIIMPAEKQEGCRKPVLGVL